MAGPPTRAGSIPEARPFGEHGRAMRITGTSTGHTIRPDSSRASQKLLYVAVFAVTGLAVYQWGLATVQRSSPTEGYTSTAKVHLPGGFQPAPEPQKIRRQITAKENLYRAVRRLAAAADPPPNEDSQAATDRAVETVTRNLRVTAGGTPPSGEVTVSITYTDQSPHYPARLVNTLAESFAAECRAEWKQQADWTHAKARETSEYAEQEFLQAKARLEEFSRQHIETQQTGPPAQTDDASQGQTDGLRSTSAETQQPDLQTAAPAFPPHAANQPLVDNPQWIELNQRLTALKRRRADLLVDRTPLHPEVREIELRIDALTRQLSAIPRKTPGERAGRPPAADRAPDPQGPPQPTDPPPMTSPPLSDPVEPSPDPLAPQPIAAAREFHTLKEAADRATEAYLQAVQLERRAWEQCQREPRIELDLAQPSPAPTPPARLQLTLLWAALGSALAVTAGVGMISVGAAIQPPFRTVAQVRTALPVPIVGIVPETHPENRPQTPRLRFSLARTTLIVGGLGMIAGCLGLLLQAWGG